MDGQADHKKNKYAHLDQLSTEALEEFLRVDMESPDNENDEAIFYILEMIEEREKERPTGRLSDVDRAWADFQKNYNTPEGAGCSLYPDEAECDDTQSTGGITQKPATVRRTHFRIRRVLLAAAVVACLVVFAVPPALGYHSFFQMLGQWTENAFHFRSNPVSSVSGGRTPNHSKHAREYETLQEALDDFGITEKVAPTQVADGFSLERVTATESPEFGIIDINAFYENDLGKSISITMTKRASGGSLTYEKDDSSVIAYTVGDITYYIFKNNERMMCAWYIGTLECSISADLTSAELKKMIDSI